MATRPARPSRRQSLVALRRPDVRQDAKLATLMDIAEEDMLAYQFCISGSICAAKSGDILGSDSMRS